MVKMGTIWERTTEVLSGRAGMLFGIAALTLVLPGIVRLVLALMLPTTTPLGAIVGFALALAVGVISLWGQLTIIAASSDPSIDAAAGYRLAAARLPAALGVTILLSIAAFVLMLPIIVALVAAHVDVTTLNDATQIGNVPSGTAAFAGFYILVLLVVFLLAAARLTVLNPVVLHERLGIGAIKRSWQLTRGLTWRILGVLVLFIVVAAIAGMALQLVVGTIAALAFGRDAVSTVLLVTTVANSVLSAAFTVIALAFTAQLYVALAGPPQRRP
jgi:hypothetical protein